MDNLFLVLNIICTVATVISTVLAIRAKNEVKRITNTIKNEGENSGVIISQNFGEAKNERKN